MSSRRLSRPPKSMQVQSIDFAGQLQSIAASQGAESDAGHEEPRNGSASTRRASLLYLYEADRIAASLSSVGPVPGTDLSICSKLYAERIYSITSSASSSMRC